GGRIDGQRCNIQIVHSSKSEDSPSPPPEMDNFMDMLAQTQSRRMDDQRVSFNYLPGFQNTDRQTQLPLPTYKTPKRTSPKRTPFSFHEKMSPKGDQNPALHYCTFLL
uniref:Purkinje cell protein 2 n=1 Tax=Anolis carolinensis TaxID=28377 RepID=A0A803T866_ANOCA